jgi:hypothetical protein
MNIQIPNHEEIKKAFSQGENAVMVLFDEFSTQIITSKIAVIATINGLHISVNKKIKGQNRFLINIY